MSDLANELSGFISQHNARRQQRASDAPPTIPPNYYAPSLILSHSGTNGPPGQSTASSSVSAYMSSGLGRLAPQTFTYTYPTAAQLPQPSGSPTPLVCEFRNFGNCEKTFDPGDESGWITHIAKHHLRYHFPAIVACWFCDRQFRASSDSQTDTEACYRKRMHHIAKHLRNGLSGSQTRPDLFLLNHLCEHGLISEEMVLKAQAYNEVPMPSLYPASWRSENWEKVAQAMEEITPTSASGASYRPGLTRFRDRHFRCDQCILSFGDQFNLNRHKERIHPNMDAWSSVSQNEDFMVSDGHYDTALLSSAQH
jgi:hypothetical protein